MHMWQLTFIDASSGYHNLELDENSSYFTISTCQFGQYWYASMPFGAASAGDVPEDNRQGILRMATFLNVFLMIFWIVGYDDYGTDQQITVCRNENLKLNKDKCFYRCTSISRIHQLVCPHSCK